MGRKARFSGRSAEALARLPGLIYALTAVAVTFIFWAYFVFFLGNLPRLKFPLVTPSADAGPAGGPIAALAIDLALIALFGLQHSLMARPGFKEWWTRLIPPALERATYVLAANLAMFLLVLLWQPIPAVVWRVETGWARGLIWALFAGGWAILLAGAMSMHLGELLGMRQAWAWYCGRPYKPLKLKINWLYARIRHPMYLGILLGLWAAPHMTAGHALLAAGLTAYLAIGARYEDRDLQRAYGESYRAYKERVPMLLPSLGRVRSGNHGRSGIGV